MKTKIVEKTEDIDLIDPIGDLRRALNTELPTQKEFHKLYNQLKNIPEFFEMAKKRTEQ
ncbi:hypothetical protein UFOVP424_35 [uncultured Caudovirales phage]|uniref:Uncharacterized protein n=1 Tax=uncultured Caudovirales phage TaxID=2100421 RepID=A0A6J5M6I6_9CAUD|nr:hypothetical protein UFOVP424_35 [uncultured Caudovirales phage]